jgi:hypothetical protein
MFIVHESRFVRFRMRSLDAVIIEMASYADRVRTFGIVARLALLDIFACKVSMQASARTDSNSSKVRLSMALREDT